jgi:hypothetical protein
MFINVNALEHSLNDMAIKSIDVFLNLQIGCALYDDDLGVLSEEIGRLICD